jgi:hypothetical protein
MSLMNPLLTATFRRRWPVLGALLILFGLSVIDQVGFRPAAERYRKALKHASELGMALEPEAAPAFLPPRLFALFTDNALPAAEAQEQGNSGSLTAQLLEDLTNLMAARGIQVVVTEPGPVSQRVQSVQVRAHLKLRCRYEQFVALLQDMARSRKLLAVDRFTLAPDASGGQVLELWVSRCVLKQGEARKP